jgi:hypothetical protein
MTVEVHDKAQVGRNPREMVSVLTGIGMGVLFGLTLIRMLAARIIRTRGPCPGFSCCPTSSHNSPQSARNPWSQEDTPCRGP